MEIERKWLLPFGAAIPLEEFKDGTLKVIEKSMVLQGYLNLKPEVRIRKKIYEDGVDKYVLTIKGNGDLVRDEFEHDISKEEFYILMGIGGLKECQLIRKDYTKLLYKDSTCIEVSKVDAGTVSEFNYIEVEFKSEEEADNFKPLDWFGEEVTYNSKYKMKKYWKITRKA